MPLAGSDNWFEGLDGSLVGLPRRPLLSGNAPWLRSILGSSSFLEPPPGLLASELLFADLSPPAASFVRRPPPPPLMAFGGLRPPVNVTAVGNNRVFETLMPGGIGVSDRIDVGAIAREKTLVLSGFDERMAGQVSLEASLDGVTWVPVGSYSYPLSSQDGRNQAVQVSGVWRYFRIRRTGDGGNPSLMLAGSVA